MLDVGMRLNMTENVSSVAPKVSSALRQISDTGEDLKEALDLGDLEQKYQKFAERVDKIYQIQARNRQIAKDQQETPTTRIFRESEKKRQDAATRAIQAGTTLVRGTGRAAAQVGSGDPAGAAGDVVGTVGGIISKSGAIGAAIAGIGAFALAVNALSKQYEKHMDGIMNINNVLDRFGNTAEETSENFRNTMTEISNASARYGYSLNEGMNIYRQLIREAGTTTSGEAKDVMFFQRWGGFDPTALAQFRGRGGRFGMGQQELLGMAYGTMGQTNMPKGLFEEFLSNTLSVFERGISRGVIRSFGEINEMQARIGTMGAQYQGRYGLNIMERLEGAATGATGLQSQADLVMFSAARRMLESQGKATDYISVQKALEGGMTQDLFRNAMQQIQLRSGGQRTDMIELMREVFPGLTYTTAEDIKTMYERGEDIEEKYLAPGGMMRESREMKILGAEEQLANFIRILGRESLWMKAGVLEKVGEKAAGAGQAIIDYQREKRDVVENREEWESIIESGVGRAMERAGAEFGGSRSWGSYTQLIEPEMEKIMSRPFNYSPEVVESITKFTNAMSTMPEDFIEYMNQNKFFTSVVAQGWQTMSEGETKRGFTAHDLGLMYTMLTDAITEFNKTVKEEKRINIYNEE